MNRYKCLSIAGFDGSGGAGIQADLKTFSALGCYGMTVLTALPVQNTCGVRNCYNIPISCIQEQLQAIFDDIVPDSIKIGMLFSSEIIELIAKFLSKNAKDIPITLDPVMVAKSGDTLLLPDAIQSLCDALIPLSTIITPNIPEAQALTKTEVYDIDELAIKLLKLGSKSVLLKGGHGNNKDSNDLYLDQNGSKIWFNGQRINSKHTHGTGCTLSAAICAYLAHGLSIPKACQYSKSYLHKAIQASKDCSIGHGHGPVHHFHNIWPNINIIGE